MATDKQVDDAVLAYLATSDGRWKKVAMVFAMVKKALSAELPDDQAGEELFDKRIETLVRAGRLVSQGNIKLWRHSEVKLS